jgi:hypothetical protein
MLPYAVQPKYPGRAMSMLRVPGTWSTGRVTRRIPVIGIGAGNPDFVTAQAVAALNDSQVFFASDKGITDWFLGGLEEENEPADGVRKAEVRHWRGGSALVAATRTSVPAARRRTAS